MPGLSAQIPATLASFGFEWDGSVSCQSVRASSYAEALHVLDTTGRCYPCRCSRSRIAAAQAADPAAEPVYPGTCRDDPGAGSVPHALRFRIEAEDGVVSFDDRFQGAVRQDCRSEAGDFVVRRRDGPFAYHLAVVVDDARDRVSEVVRGADLLSCTPRQILLQRALGFWTPAYAHLPLLTEPDGRKLSKSRRAVALDPRDAPRQLWQALEWLGQSPPAELARAPVRDIWAWATANWRPERLRGVRERRLEENGPP